MRILGILSDFSRILGFIEDSPSFYKKCTRFLKCQDPRLCVSLCVCVCVCLSVCVSVSVSVCVCQGDFLQLSGIFQLWEGGGSSVLAKCTEIFVVSGVPGCEEIVHVNS